MVCLYTVHIVEMAAKKKKENKSTSFDLLHTSEKKSITGNFATGIMEKNESLC